MEDGRIAIPSMGTGGLDGERSGHFGHCDVFTFVDVEGGEVKQVRPQIRPVVEDLIAGKLQIIGDDQVCGGGGGGH
ncbi:MAG: hypothetical protein B6240_11940 [Desulfobacteraceae bacterium 4572_87]|nr:MAG: hypothetical protein B6240_11940 [Desulfobacteraceae bacterium 4572_87]